MTDQDIDAGQLYAGREQTLIKHFILDKYLDRFAHIVGTFWDTLTYVDCFSGPWNVQSDKLQDSSFSIALKQLRKARADLAAHGRSLSIRCFFLEKDPIAYGHLRRFATGTTDAEVETCNATLEESVPHIVRFVERGHGSAFPFIFVDPTGWKGLGMKVIAPLLRLNPGEVLVNFMTGHIERFAEHRNPTNRATFDRLFGPIDYRSRIRGLTGQERQDELVRCYMDAIQETGRYDYVCAALVLNPEKERTHFHLIYATRHPKGVEEFKKVEKQAMAVMEAARGEAQQRSRVKKTGQGEFAFEGALAPSGVHYEQLRNRYLKAAEQHLEALLAREKKVLFADMCIGALQFPLVWESDVKEWIRHWKEQGRVRLEGLTPRERKPKRDKEHWVVLDDRA